jgi:hypothetical protein
MLEEHHAYEVESVAHKGDRVEEMAYGLGQLEELGRALSQKPYCYPAAVTMLAATSLVCS